MDLLLYDPPLPDLPLLHGLGPEAGEGPATRFDWAGYVVRLAQAVAERKGGKPIA